MHDFQTAEFLSFAKEYDQVLQVFELQFDRETMLLKTGEAFTHFYTEFLVAKNFSKYFFALLDRMKQDQDNIDLAVLEQVL